MEGEMGRVKTYALKASGCFICMGKHGVATGNRMLQVAIEFILNDY
jgi:hypothetical protein